MMPDWRFLVVRHFAGKKQRQEICSRIKQRVQESGLSSVLPLVRYELSNAKEYYLGIAVNSEASRRVEDAREAARKVLEDVGIAAALHVHSCFDVDADEVQKFLKGTLACESFTCPIAYEKPEEDETPAWSQLLAEIDTFDSLTTEVDARATEGYSNLLYWCCSLGSGGLDRIQQACQALDIDVRWGGAWSVLKRLTLLGHLEFDTGSSIRWGVIPSLLVTPAMDNGKRILVGQRTPAMLESLRATTDLEEHPQSGGPPCILVAGMDKSIPEAGCVSRRLAELLPDINDWKDRLPKWEEKDFDRYETEKFDACSGEFRYHAKVMEPVSAGLYRFTLNSARRMTILSYFDDTRDKWIGGDFYGLRFLARSSLGLCHAAYRRVTGELLVPIADRWPMPYERTLVLASGRLPSKRCSAADFNLLSYSGLTEDLAGTVCNLLGLKMDTH